MFLTITIALLALALTMLQLLRPSRSGWDLAKAICVVLAGLTVWNAYEQDRDREFTVSSLRTIASRIDWDETEASVEFIDAPDRVSASDVSVYVKIVMPRGLSTPAKLDLLHLQQACARDDRWKYDYLPEPEAERLFRAFERPDGSTFVADETKAGIEHLFYEGQSIAQT